MYRILELNPQLQCFSGDIDLRMQLYRDTKRRLIGEDGKLIDFANAHEYYGFHRIEGGWVYREWAPKAEKMYFCQKNAKFFVNNLTKYCKMLDNIIKKYIQDPKLIKKI